MATIDFNNTVYAAGFFGTDDDTPANTFQIDDVYGFPVTLNGSVTGVGSTVTLTYTLPGATTQSQQTLTATQYDNASMIQFAGTGLPGTPDGDPYRYVFSNTRLFGAGSPNRTRFTADGNGTVGDYVIPVCFASGTGILVVRDGVERDVEVEHLRIGDLAVTASGARRPIRWIGHRTMRPTAHAEPWAVHPVKVRAGAFGADLPARDLFLSPGHPVLVGEGADEHLVPIMCLVNGTTVERVAVDEVTYWHVELDAHDILLAEGLAAESYLDWGDRPFFAEGSDHRLHNPDFVVPGLAARCRPVAVDGAVVDAERARLDGVFASSLGAMCAWHSPEAAMFGG